MQDLTDIPRRNVLKARYLLGEAVRNTMLANKLTPEPLAYSNLQKLKQKEIISSQIWETLDRLRNDGNKAYHEHEFALLEDTDIQNYIEQVENAIDDALN